MSAIKSVLFVCTGNSCRSVMAEGLLKKYLKDLGKKHIDVRSCGVSAVNGLQPTGDTIDAMSKEGVDVAGYRSKRLTELLIKKSDLILTMSRSHKDEVVRAFPEAASKTYLLKEFGRKSASEGPAEDMEISDPIGKSAEFYNLIMEEIRKEAERIAEIL